MLWSLAAVGSLSITIYDGILNDSDVFSHNSYSSAQVAPEGLVLAFNSGEMSAPHRETIIRALNEGKFNLAPGAELRVKKEFVRRFTDLWVAAILLTLFAFAIGMFQYLCLGYPSPIRLFKSNP